ncbi:MAG: heme ABC transporter ATP-binding protein [Brumimicrobium sp.]
MLIHAQNITFARRNFRILNQVDLSINKGELVVFLGPNGAGKSTLLSVLSKEVKETSKDVSFKNKSLSEWKTIDLAFQKAKFSQENNREIELVVKDIILMGRYPYFDSLPRDKDWKIVEEAMRETEVFHLKEQNYNSLSGGEKQRVHLARVFAQLNNSEEGKIAFFDEPLNNLDVRHQYRILEKIVQFTRQGNVAVIVLHDLNLAAEYADRVLLLKKGKVVAMGTPKEVFNEKTIFQAYDFPCKIVQHPITENPMVLFKN